MASSDDLLYLQNVATHLKSVFNDDLLPLLTSVQNGINTTDPVTLQKLNDLQTICNALGVSVFDIAVRINSLHTHNNLTFLDQLTSLKTINNQSLIGSGDIAISTSSAVISASSDSSGNILTTLDFGSVFPTIYKKMSLANVGKCVIRDFVKIGAYVAMDSIYFYDYSGNLYNFGSFTIDSTDGNTSSFSNGSISVTSRYNTEYPVRCLLDGTYTYGQSYWLTSESSPKVTITFASGLIGLSGVSFVPRPSTYTDRGFTSCWFDFYDQSGLNLVASFQVSLGAPAQNALISQNMAISSDANNYKYQAVSTFEMFNIQNKIKLSGLTPNAEYKIKT